MLSQKNTYTLRLVHTMWFISFATVFFENFLLWFKAVCSHSATATCIDTYWYCTSQSHRMGIESIHVQHHTHKCITVAPYEQSHWHPHNPFFIAVAFTKKSHRVNEPLRMEILYQDMLALVEQSLEPKWNVS